MIQNINDEIWRIFVGYCKVDDKTVGEKLSEILDNYNRNRPDFINASELKKKGG